MREKVDIVSWSLCGDQTAILNVNSEIRISPQTSRDKGLMTVSYTGPALVSEHRIIQDGHLLQRLIMLTGSSPGRLVRWAAAHALPGQLALLLGSSDNAPTSTVILKKLRSRV